MAHWMMFNFAFAVAGALATSLPDSLCKDAATCDVLSLLQTSSGKDTLGAVTTVNGTEFVNLSSGDSSSSSWSSSYHSTPWQDAGEGKLVYLDRHDVACGGALQGFKLERKGEQWSYTFKCSDEKAWINNDVVVTKNTSSKALMEGKEGYLVDYWIMMRDNHVKCDDGYALKEFQLKTWHAADRTFGEIVWENLRNTYDIIDIIDPKDETARMSLMWYEYKCVQINKNNFASRQVHWATEPNDYCQHCGYNAGYYLDRHGVFAPDNGLLTEFWSEVISTKKFNFDLKFAQKL